MAHAKPSAYNLYEPGLSSHELLAGNECTVLCLQVLELLPRYWLINSLNVSANNNFGCSKAHPITLIIMTLENTVCTLDEIRDINKTTYH